VLRYVKALLWAQQTNNQGKAHLRSTQVGCTCYNQQTQAKREFETLALGASAEGAVVQLAWLYKAAEERRYRSSDASIC